MSTLTFPRGVVITGPIDDAGHTILSPDAVEFVANLVRTFRGDVTERLHARRARTALGFLPETASIREGAWTVAPLPDALLDRRVEITGPVDRKNDYQRAELRCELFHGRL